MKLHQLRLDYSAEQERLPQKVVGSTDWDLALSLPHGLVPDPERIARTIN